MPDKSAKLPNRERVFSSTSSGGKTEHTSNTGTLSLQRYNGPLSMSLQREMGISKIPRRKQPITASGNDVSVKTLKEEMKPRMAKAAPN